MHKTKYKSKKYIHTRKRGGMLNARQNPRVNPSRQTNTVFRPLRRDEIDRAINMYYSNRERAILEYGEINNWDVSNITDMSSLFKNKETFNENINNWDVSHVTNMSLMFFKAKSFNQPLDNWNVSNVKDMMGMFREAEQFNQSLDNWNVSNVKYMPLMFMSAQTFNQPLNSWDVSNVEDMMGMFKSAKKFNQPLDNWNVSNVRIMEYMFQNAEMFNQHLNWNVSDQCDTSNMFPNSQGRLIQPRQEQPRQEQPRQEQPRLEQPRQEQPRLEQPRQEQPRLDDGRLTGRRRPRENEPNLERKPEIVELLNELPSDAEDRVCPICLENLIENLNGKVYKTGICKNYFHIHCLDKHCEGKGIYCKCPMCRTYLNFDTTRVRFDTTRGGKKNRTKKIRLSKRKKTNKRFKSSRKR